MPNNYVLLDRIELNRAVTSVTFDSIPQTGYTDLKVVVSARAVTDTQSAPVLLSINGNTSNLSSRRILGTGGSAISQSGSGNSGIGGVLGNGSDFTANTFGNGEFYIPNYTSANPKSISIDSTNENNASGSYMSLAAVLWNSTAAITSITLTQEVGNLAVGSTFSLYGIAKLGTTPAIAPKADGGNVVATDGTYWYHAFLSNGTFTPQVGLNADVLVVAGGGGGGNNYGAGGGAGGLVYLASQSLINATSYTCTIGGGGAGSVNNSIIGTVGQNSQLGSLTAAVGGGGGGSLLSSSGGNGGSGGGGATTLFAGSGTAGTGTAGQGFAGGAGNANSFSAGGGGASAVGASGVGTTGGAGGAGSNSYSTWATATSTGVSGYYAGGGGGSAASGGTGGAGGAGGGGTGGAAGAATSATTNTGGGGGGGANASPNTGGNGGSGIVIVRYLVA